jgi:hypothetical protein
MAERAKFRVVAFGTGLIGSAAAVLFAFLYVAANDWFGASDIASFAFWSAPFAVLMAAVALLSRSWLQQASRTRRIILSALLGLCYGLVWTVAVALGMGPWIGAFSFPILYLWMLGGLSAMLIWAAFVGRVTPNGDQLELPRATKLRRIMLLILGVPIGAVAIAVGIAFGALYGTIYLWGRAEPELHLIPEGFEGPVLIAFNDPDGTQPKYDGKSRLYEIPPSGVLRTQFPPNDGWSRPVYAYVDEQGNRTPIVTGAPCEDLPDDPVQVCSMGQRIDGDASGRLTRPEYNAYVVGRRGNRRELYAKGDSLVSVTLFGGQR